MEHKQEKNNGNIPSECIYCGGEMVQTDQEADTGMYIDHYECASCGAACDQTFTLVEVDDWYKD